MPRQGFRHRRLCGRWLAGLALLGSLTVVSATDAAAQGTQTADAQVLMSEARRYFDSLDYDKAVAALDRTIAILESRPASDPSRQDLGAAYEIRARSRFNLGDEVGAKSDFVSLLKVNPGFTMTGQISPRVIALFNDALAATVTTLKLSVTPETAEVRVDGVPVAANSLMPVAVGDHVIVAKQLGYREASQTIQAVAATPSELTLSLERISAVLSILTTPVGVEVVIDGISHGKTAQGPPPAKYAEAAAKAGVPATDVSSVMVVADIAPGPHVLEFKRDCYVRAERRVQVDRPDDYSVDLVKLDHAVAKIAVKANQPNAQVFIDSQARGIAPFTTADLCEGAHTVEIRSASGRYFKRIESHPGDSIDVSGALRPAFALVATAPATSALASDPRLMVEHALEPSQSITIFAPGADQLDPAIKAQQLPPGWMAFDPKGRPVGVAADLSLQARQELATKLAKIFDAQGVASLTFPSPADRSRVVVSLLGAGSGEPDILELNLDATDSIVSTIARLDQRLSFFRPAIGLSAIDVADVAGTVVIKVDPAGPAAKAGVQVGDIVTKANAQPVADAAALATVLAAHKADDELTLELTGRAGPKRADLKVYLTPRVVGMADQTLLANRILVDLRARLLTPGDQAEEAVVRLNLAMVLMRLQAWSEARLELQRVKLPDGSGVANGTVQYLLGLCAERLGNRQEAETAWRAASSSDAMLSEDGPSVKELAEARLASKSQ